MEALDSSVITASVDDDKASPKDTEQSLVVVHLNTDCLIKIFSYLEMFDLFSVEKVSHTWREAALIVWRRFTEFDCNDASHLMDMYSHQIRHMLKRCGSCMKTFYFPSREDFCDINFYKTVEKYCEKLTKVVFYTPQYRKKVVKGFSTILNKIQVIELHDLQYFSQVRPVTSILLKAKNLQILKLHGTDYKVFESLPKVFCKLPLSLREIHLGDLHFSSDDVIEVLSRCCPQLETLTANANFRTILKKEHLLKLSKMKRLELTYCGIDAPEMAAILNLHNLEKLVLTKCSCVTDEFLIGLPENLPLLRHLNLSDADQRNVTDKGMFAIAKLENLEHLDLSYFHNKVTDVGVGAIAQKGRLRELIIISTMISDNVMSDIADHCHQLEILDLSGCQNITEEGLHSLASVLKTAAKDRPKLKVLVGGSGVALDGRLATVFRNCPKLEIDIDPTNSSYFLKLNGFNEDYESSDSYDMEDSFEDEDDIIFGYDNDYFDYLERPYLYEDWD